MRELDLESGPLVGRALREARLAWRPAKLSLPVRHWPRPKRSGEELGSEGAERHPGRQRGSLWSP